MKRRVNQTRNLQEMMELEWIYLWQQDTNFSQRIRSYETRHAVVIEATIWQ